MSCMVIPRSRMTIVMGGMKHMSLIVFRGRYKYLVHIFSNTSSPRLSKAARVSYARDATRLTAGARLGWCRKIKGVFVSSTKLSLYVDFKFERQH